MAGGYDAVVVGSGPNGLAAAVELARAGSRVLVVEAADRVGGGLRSEELTLPGFIHDVCSSVHPWPLASPFLRSLPLARHGLRWVHPDVPLAHPLDDGSAAVLERSVEDCARWLGPDGDRWRRVFEPLVEDADMVVSEVLRPLIHVPRHPVALARFGLRAAGSVRRLATRFRTNRARALLAGLAAHAILPLNRLPTGPVALAFGMLAHRVGWPFAAGGSQRIADALVAHLAGLGGEIETGRRVTSLDELPPARAVLLDVTPRALSQIAGRRLPPRYHSALKRFRYGPGVFKVDWALDAPIPWTAQDCARAGTVHVGGTFDEIAGAEAAVWRGGYPERPFVLVAQPTLFDPTRAPAGRHTAWAYCHVPNGSAEDMTDRIEAQIERFAPGFRDRILARSKMSPSDMERHNKNNVGGDIAGGAQTLWQIIARPTLRPVPYATSARGIYLCSSSTPPGAGVHGMCGYNAARAALRRGLR